MYEDQLDFLTLISQRPAWHRRAACRGVGTRMFFPVARKASEEARAICARCPVTAECARAGENEPYGVWAADEIRNRRRRTRAG